MEARHGYAAAFGNLERFLKRTEGRGPASRRRSAHPGRRRARRFRRARAAISFTVLVWCAPTATICRSVVRPVTACGSV